MKKEMNSEKLIVGADDHGCPQNRNTQKGITLIALIITIIILIILAMVSVRIVTDSNITKHAENAADTYTVEQEKELINVGYSAYKMQKYIETEDLNYLKEYFIGHNLMDLVAESNGSMATLTNGIVINEDDVEYIEDEKAKIPFNYNDCSYKLTVSNSGDSTVAENIEIVGTITVEGATISGDEDSCWEITFSQSNGNENTYILLNNGKIIDNKWWELTNEEETEIVYDSYNENWNIAQSDTCQVSFSSENKDVLCININNAKLYTFLLTDEGVNNIYAMTGVKCKKYQWYSMDIGNGGTNWTNVQTHSGGSPISLEDFTSEQIVSRTFLQRMIENF